MYLFGCVRFVRKLKKKIHRFNYKYISCTAAYSLFFQVESIFYECFIKIINHYNVIYNYTQYDIYPYNNIYIIHGIHNTYTSVLLLIGERQFYKEQNTRLHLKTTRHNFFINFFSSFFIFFIQICSGNFNARDKSLCLYQHLSFRYSIHIICICAAAVCRCGYGVHIIIYNIYVLV